MCRRFIQIVVWIVERIPQRRMVRNCGCHWHCKISNRRTWRSAIHGFTWDCNFIFPFRGKLAGASGHRHSVKPVSNASQKNWRLHHSGNWFRYRWHWRRRIRLPPAFRRPPQGTCGSMFSTRLFISVFRFLTFFMRTAAPIGTQPTCMGKGRL